MNLIDREKRGRYKRLRELAGELLVSAANENETRVLDIGEEIALIVETMKLSLREWH